MEINVLGLALLSPARRMLVKPSIKDKNVNTHIRAKRYSLGSNMLDTNKKQQRAQVKAI